LPDNGIRQLVVLATGWARHVGEEAALKVRESSGAWVESYAVGEYRHGPVATCGPGTLVWGLDRIPDDIVEVVESAGGRVEHGCGEPLAELARIHRYAVALATAAGRDADHPYLLSLGHPPRRRVTPPPSPVERPVQTRREAGSAPSRGRRDSEAATR
jgi:glucosamine--fructose-6-phosphate aminotransferase (isomerizing)